MGNNQPKEYTTEELNDKTDTELKKRVVYLIKYGTIEELKKTLDVILKRKNTVDLYYNDTDTLPYIILLTLRQNSHELKIMEYILSNYSFDLNKEIPDIFGGTVLYKTCSELDDYKKQIMFCDMFLEHGADINAVGKYQLEYEDQFSQKLFTALDVAHFDQLKKYLVKKGAKKYHDLPKEVVCPSCKKDVIV